ncbi:MAG TPA: response regulator transcription factor [Flavisolibacter sp.]|jgi:DNA-binding NarL/FixJ family response regulator|nr:response regulator transcription factor [Flavisolibacter sp.]
MTPKLKVALVDDHKLFREGLAELVNGFSNYKVFLEADNGKQLIEKLNAKDLPDIILLDISMQEMDGYETAGWLKQHYPAIKVMVLSMFDNENAIIRMMRLGVKGYVLKDIRKKDLKEALDSIHTKGYYYSDLVTGKLIHTINKIDEEKEGNSIKGLMNLTEREIEFLKLACTELTYREVADKMCLSVHTIDGYRDALFEKLNVKSRVGLVLYGIRNRVVDIDLKS